MSAEPDPFEMTPERRALALEHCATMDLGSIARLCFGETDTEGRRIDGRHLAARAVRAFLAGEGKEVSIAGDQRVPNTPLSDEQKKMIEELAPRMREGGSLELARIVWNDPTLTPLHKQARVVRDYMKEVYPEGVNMSEEPVEDKEWKPPVSVNALVSLVNTYVAQSDTRKTYNAAALKPTERKCLNALMIYMRSFKMKVATSKYDKEIDRGLFLSSFIRWTHDKPDLTQIEQDQFILAAEEIVNIMQIDRSLQRIDKMQEEITLGLVTDENGKRVKLGMTDVELINAVRTKHETAKKRLESLMKNLETARSDREKERKDRYVSVVDILDAWAKNADIMGNGPLRDRWLEAGKEEKAEDAAEVERLSALEEMVALISGQTKDEARS